ncbi:MAG: hypothetical protein QOF09_2190 [Alphaproteobacteria bacterium]|nr:hypothetical protein [Alphaproteobacteria bacterium]
MFAPWHFPALPGPSAESSRRIAISGDSIGRHSLAAGHDQDVEQQTSRRPTSRLINVHSSRVTGDLEASQQLDVTPRTARLGLCHA